MHARVPFLSWLPSVSFGTAETAAVNYLVVKMSNTCFLASFDYLPNAPYMNACRVIKQLFRVCVVCGAGQWLQRGRFRQVLNLGRFLLSFLCVVSHPLAFHFEFDGFLEIIHNKIIIARLNVHPRNLLLHRPSSLLLLRLLLLRFSSYVSSSGTS